MSAEVDRLRGHSLLPEPAVLADVPSLYATDGSGFGSKQIYASYFTNVGSARWLMAEFDGSQLAFGYCDLGLGTPEWGYFSLFELSGLLVVREGFPIYVERDLHWTPRRFDALGL